MQQDHLYTVFDHQWNPSDALEDALAVVESDDALLFQRLHKPSYTSTADDREQLCSVLALQATRHPDVLRWGAKRSRQLAEVLADAHDCSLEGFKTQMAEFGLSETDAHDCYIVLLSRTKEQLADELAELKKLSPQSPQLPEQDALRAKPVVESALREMDLWLLDTPPTEEYILGDTPIPQFELKTGFSVPLSRSLAVMARPAQGAQTLLSRRNATPDEVREINRIQYDNALSTVVGPSASLLAAF
jgi:hypothetical protein